MSDADWKPCSEWMHAEDGPDWKRRDLENSDPDHSYAVEEDRSRTVVRFRIMKGPKLRGET